MNNFSEYDLLMVYLNECEDKQLEQQILSSPQARERLVQMEKEMNNIENNINISNTIDPDYGHQLWHNISSKLDQQPETESVFTRIKNRLFMPQFSLASIAMVFVASVTFYLIGSGQHTSNMQNQSNQLLAQNIQYHLAQSDVFLTQVSTMPEHSQSKMMVNTAKQLLSSNRLYKMALNSNTNDDSKSNQLNQLLIELEQVLTELSNGSTDQKQEYIFQFTNDQLLYKVKTLNKQLKNDNTFI